MTRRASRAESLTLPGPAGSLEAVLETPPEPASRLAVVCHPHPLHGGTMHNKVVHTLARSFVRLGARTLRFNFRGVGTSAGEYAHGDGELEDAQAAIGWLRERFGSQPLYLAGFSFGAVVAARALAAVDCAGLVTVAPPVDRLPEPFPRAGCPWLLVQGDADDVVDAGRVAAWIERLVDPPAFELIAGAGHFFHGRLPELAELVEQHFAPEVHARAGDARC